MKTLLLFLIFFNSSFTINPEPASETLFKQMIANRPNHISSPGATRTVTFQEFNIGKPFIKTIEFGNTPGADKKVKVYPVIARFTLATNNYNTVTGQKYTSSKDEYRRPYEFYVDKTNKWVCVAKGLTKEMY